MKQASKLTTVQLERLKTTSVEHRAEVVKFLLASFDSVEISTPINKGMELLTLVIDPKQTRTVNKLRNKLILSHNENVSIFSPTPQR